MLIRNCKKEKKWRYRRKNSWRKNTRQVENWEKQKQKKWKDTRALVTSMKIITIIINK